MTPLGYVWQDWQVFDTTLVGGLRLFDRAVAERLGWTLLCLPTELDDERGKWVWEWHDPTGRRCGWTFKVPDSVDDFFYPNPAHAIPHYTTDLNAAWTLIEGIKSEITLGNYPHTGWTLVSFWDKVWHTGKADTPALAICVAWMRQWDYLHGIGTAFEAAENGGAL